MCYATQDYPTQWPEDSNYFKERGSPILFYFPTKMVSIAIITAALSLCSTPHPVIQLAYNTDNHITIS